jgi:dTDP-4-dehydrorhamnose reductase
MLILGATGFLGSTLFNFAEKLDYQVLGTSRFSNERSNLIKMDVNDKGSMEQIINKFLPDIVVWTLLSRDKEDVLIISGLTNLLSIISEKTKLVFMSTDALFSEGKGGYSELYQPSLLPKEAPLSNYVNSKILGEKKIQEQHQNHIIIRTGPLYGKDVNQNIEQRTQKVLKEIEEHNSFIAATNLFKTFVHIEDLSKAVMELSEMNFSGTLHVGPSQKASYYSFYKQRVKSLGYDETTIKPIELNPYEQPYFPLDTSLNTQKAKTLLELQFRSV